MSIKVKICGVTDPRNVEGLNKFKPEYLGVILVESSPRFVPNFDVVRAIHKSRGDSNLVAVVKDPTMELLSSICSLEIFSAVQIHGEGYKESAEYIRMQSRSLQLWRAFSLDEDTVITEIGSRGPVDMVIFDGKSPGSGTPFNWNELARQEISIPFFVAGGIGPENAQRVVETFGQHEYFVGVDINSRVESRPGIKDANLVAKVMMEAGRLL